MQKWSVAYQSDTRKFSFFTVCWTCMEVCHEKRYYSLHKLDT
jgi:hypothetical protein